MDIVQKCQLHISEVKAKITDLLETPTEKRGEDYDGDLEKAMKMVRPAETQLQAALLAQPEETAEKVVEKRAEVTETAEDKAETELRSKINFCKYIGAAMAGTGVTSGAEGELNEHLGLAANQFPMDLLAPEVRAARDGDADVMARSWVDRVFADSAAMRLGINFESVPSGIAAYPITTAGGNPAQRGRTQASSEETYTCRRKRAKAHQNGRARDLFHRGQRTSSGSCRQHPS